MQLDRACRLLRETDLPMEAVARGSGFRSTSTLFRRCCTVLDMTPRQWRQRQRRVPGTDPE